MKKILNVLVMTTTINLYIYIIVGIVLGFKPILWYETVKFFFIMICLCTPLTSLYLIEILEMGNKKDRNE